MIPRVRTSRFRALALGLFLASGYTSLPFARDAGSPSPWTERLIATFPRGHFANRLAWDSWITFTPDLARIAYADRYRTGNDMRETVILDGKPGPEFLFASRPVLSPDGKHLAHLGVPAGKPGLPAFLVLGNMRVQIQIKDNLLTPAWIPAFSPDSRRLAFRAERPSGKYAIGVIDATAPVDAATGELSVAWGPEFVALDRPRWSPDSSNVAYAGGRSRDEWVVVVGTEPHATYKDVTGVTFGPDGALAYIASEGAKRFIVMGTYRGPAFDVVTEPSFSANGALVYGASDAGRHFIVIGADKREVPHAVEGAAVSTDGTRVMSWYREGSGGRQRMVMNGVPGRYFPRVSRPALHANAGTFAYTAQDKGVFYIVTPRGMGQELSGVQWNPQISEDGSKTGFFAILGDQLWWKVVGLR
jgi:hypothetical protein